MLQLFPRTRLEITFFFILSFSSFWFEKVFIIFIMIYCEIVGSIMFYFSSLFIRIYISMTAASLEGDSLFVMVYQP